MLNSGSLLLQSRALGEVPETFGHCCRLAMVEVVQVQVEVGEMQCLGQLCCQAPRQTPQERQ